MRLLSLAALPAALVGAVLPAAAQAGTRSYSVGSFERVRIEGPFQVRIVTGSPGARAEADPALLDRLRIDATGTTLVVRLGDTGWGETPTRAARTQPVITLTTPRLTSVVVVAGAEVRVDAMKAQRIDIGLTGAGTLAVAKVETDQLVASVAGAGVMTLGGTAQRARLTLNGPGAIDGALSSNDLIVRLEGSGRIETNARYTAQVTTTGLGKVTVRGKATCVVKAAAGGPVDCGTGAP